MNPNEQSQDLSLHWAHSHSVGFVMRRLKSIWLLQLYRKLTNYVRTINWATTWQNQQNECAPSEDSDQPGHPPSLITVFAVVSLGIHPVWSESSLCAQWVAEDPSFLHADSKVSDQTERMLRLIWVFAGHTLILLVLSCRGSLTKFWMQWLVPVHFTNTIRLILHKGFFITFLQYNTPKAKRKYIFGSYYKPKIWG